MFTFARHAIAGTIGAAAAIVAVLAGAPTAYADPPPNCTAADRAGVAANVSAGMSVYLFTHPEVNAFFSGLEGQPRDQIGTQVKEYMESHPQIKAELQGVRQPLIDMRNRCGINRPIVQAIP